MRPEAALRHGGGDGGEGFHLRFVQRVLVGVLLAVGGQAAEVEVFRGFFDGDEAALDQRGERRGGDAEFAQVCDSRMRPPAAASSARMAVWLSLSLGMRASGTEHGDALGAAGVALLGEGFAERATSCGPCASSRALLAWWRSGARRLWRRCRPRGS